MGMHDNFTIDYPLPIADYIPEKYRPYIYSSINQDGFQSKNLECEFCNYYISKTGKMYKKPSSFFDIQKEKREFTQIEYHGILNVYTFIILDEDDFNKSFWLEYDIKFTDGIISLVTMTSPTEKNIYELHKNI
jgi:hypothetical protein